MVDDLIRQIKNTYTLPQFQELKNTLKQRGVKPAPQAVAGGDNSTALQIFYRKILNLEEDEDFLIELATRNANSSRQNLAPKQESTMVRSSNRGEDKRNIGLKRIKPLLVQELSLALHNNHDNIKLILFLLINFYYESHLSLELEISNLQTRIKKEKRPAQINALKADFKKKDIKVTESILDFIYGDFKNYINIDITEIVDILSVQLDIILTEEYSVENREVLLIDIEGLFGAYRVLERIWHEVVMPVKNKKLPPNISASQENFDGLTTYVNKHLQRDPKAKFNDITNKFNDVIHYLRTGTLRREFIQGSTIPLIQLKSFQQPIKSKKASKASKASKAPQTFLREEAEEREAEEREQLREPLREATVSLTSVEQPIIDIYEQLSRGQKRRLRERAHRQAQALENARQAERNSIQAEERRRQLQAQTEARERRNAEEARILEARNSYNGLNYLTAQLILRIVYNSLGGTHEERLEKLRREDGKVQSVENFISENQGLPHWNAREIKPKQLKGPFIESTFTIDELRPIWHNFITDGIRKEPKLNIIFNYKQSNPNLGFILLSSGVKPDESDDSIHFHLTVEKTPSERRGSAGYHITNHHFKTARANIVRNVISQMPHPPAFGQKFHAYFGPDHKYREFDFSDGGARKKKTRTHKKSKQSLRSHTRKH